MNVLKVEGQAKKLTSCKIILLTNFHTSVNNDKIEEIINGINDMKIKLITFSDDIRYFNDDLLGVFSQAPTKSQQQNESEALFSRVVKETGGFLCHIDYVEVEQLHFQKKTTKSMPWNTFLTIGSDLKIAISSYKYVEEEKFLKPFKTECSKPNTRTKLVTDYMIGEYLFNQKKI